MKFQEFTDYAGPTGSYVATGTKILALDSTEGISAVAQSAMLTALGSSAMADQYAAKVTKSLQAAHDAGSAATLANASAGNAQIARRALESAASTCLSREAVAIPPPSQR